jgi:serpin B
MAETLCYNLPQNRLHRAFNALDVELACRSEGARSKDEEGFRLSIANSM